MTTFQIKNRLTGCVQFECELSAEVARGYGLRLGIAVRQAIKAGANLTGADLSCANLTGVDLAGAALTGASLAGAYLTRANLADADLTGANLLDADLMHANLTRANLTGANLLDADLTGAYLTGANLLGTNLSRAYLATIRNDLWDVLLRARDEIVDLLDTLRAGRIDGSVYEGDCACLVGTIANIRGVRHDSLGRGLVPDESRPVERWFLAIRRGDTPATSQVAKITEGWIVKLLDLLREGAA